MWEITSNMFVVFWLLMCCGCSELRTNMIVGPNYQKKLEQGCVEEALRKKNAVLAMQKITMSENVDTCGSAEYVCGLILYKGQQEAKKYMIDLEFNLAIRNRKVKAVRPHCFNTQDLIRCFDKPKVDAKSCAFAYIGKAGDSLWSWLDFYCDLLHFVYKIEFSNDCKKIIVNIGSPEIMNSMYIRKSYVVPKSYRSKFEHMLLPQELPCYETEGVAYFDGCLELIGKNSKMFDVLHILLESKIIAE